MSKNTSNYNAKYYESNRHKIAVRRANERAIAAGVKSTLTVNMWEKILRQHGNKCALCGRPGGTARDRLCIDHIVPFSKGGPNTKPNTQPACAKCFSAKSARFASEERARKRAAMVAKYKEEREQRLRKSIPSQILTNEPK